MPSLPPTISILPFGNNVAVWPSLLVPIDPVVEKRVTVTVIVAFTLSPAGFVTVSVKAVVTVRALVVMPAPLVIVPML